MCRVCGYVPSRVLYPIIWSRQYHTQYSRTHEWYRNFFFTYTYRQRNLVLHNAAFATLENFLPLLSIFIHRQTHAWIVCHCRARAHAYIRMNSQFDCIIFDSRIFCTDRLHDRLRCIEWTSSSLFISFTHSSHRLLCRWNNGQGIISSTTWLSLRTVPSINSTETRKQARICSCKIAYEIWHIWLLKCDETNQDDWSFGD